MIDKDISCASVDLVSINAYPGTIPMTPGRPEALKRQVEKRFTRAIERFRKLYPEKPLIVSESGCGGVAGRRDPLNASPNTEDFQD